jgi:hypothetical protein
VDLGLQVLERPLEKSIAVAQNMSQMAVFLQVLNEKKSNQTSHGPEKPAGGGSSYAQL